MSRRKQKYFTPVFLLLLFATLLLVFHSSFGNPPRSDYWSAFYFFRWVDHAPTPPTIFHVLTYDPWNHGTFRPLSFFILYLQHRTFGTTFAYSHLCSFLAYFVAAALLYRLGGELAIDRTLRALFVFLWACLFSHFDIVTWTFHIYSLFGFCFSLLAFIVFIRYLKTGAAALLPLTGLLFLLSILAYEVFAAWPLGIMLLSLSPFLVSGRKPGLRPLKSAVITVAAVYLLYLGAYLVSQSIGRFDVGTGPSRQGIHFGIFLLGIMGALFNFFYTGIGVNAFPILAVPALVRENIDMGGMLLRWQEASSLRGVVIGVGAATLVLLLATGIILFRKRRYRFLHLMGFLLFLLFSNFFIILLARLTTNPLFYAFTQFRYQYVPNAMVMLLAAAALDRLLRPNRRDKILIACALIPILGANLLLTHTYTIILKGQFRPLKTMLNAINEKLESGQISDEEPLYIEYEVTSSLPILSWNEAMSRFMRGTYQWYFPPRSQNAFSLDRDRAAWIIRAEDPTTIQRLPDTPPETEPAKPRTGSRR